MYQLKSKDIFGLTMLQNITNLILIYSTQGGKALFFNPSSEIGHKSLKSENKMNLVKRKI